MITASWPQQAIAFARRETWRAFHNTWLIVCSFLALIGGFLAYRYSAPGSSSFLFLQAQLFLLPLLATLIGCSSAHEDIEELPVLFSQPIFRCAYLWGKWLSLFFTLAVISALAMLPSAVFGDGGAPIVSLWLQGLALSGVFAALGLVLGISRRDRARGLIASLLAWLFLVFGWDALSWLAILTGIAEKWPVLWILILFVNPTATFRIAALLTLEDIPFHVPAAEPLTAWLLHNTTFLVFALSFLWILVTMALGIRSLHRGLDNEPLFLRRLFRKRKTTT